MSVKICLDYEGFKDKPADKRVISRISQRIAGQQGEGTVEEIAELVGGQGHTFCPAVFKNGRRATGEFMEMQLFGIDFDEGICYESVKQTCSVYGIPICFSYHTFSSTPKHPKFRIILCHITPVKELWLAQMILCILKEMFPSADKSCFEVSRMFFGGKGIIEADSGSVFCVDSLVRGFESYKHRSDKKNYVRNMARFAQKHGIGLLEKGILAVSTYKYGEMEDISGNSIKYIIEIPEISSKIVFYNGDRRGELLHQKDMCGDMPKLEKAGKDELCKKCRLCRSFFEGKILDHDMRFLLATNFLWIAGAKKLFFETMRNYYDSADKWEKDWDYIQANKYKPMACAGTCPYAEWCSHDTNLYLTLKGGKRIIKLTAEEKYGSIEESYRSMENALRQAVKHGGNAICLIKGQTGLGKSTAYKKLMKEAGFCMVIAVPTVKLKHEIAESVGDIAVELLSIKDLGMPDFLADEVEELYSRGLYQDARGKIREYKKQLPDGSEKARYETYLKQMDLLEKRDRHVIMTHAQLIQTGAAKLEGYKIIIDEDILYTILRNTKSVGINDIQRCLNSRLVIGEAALKLQKVLTLEDGAYMKSGSSGDRIYISGKNS